MLARPPVTGTFRGWPRSAHVWPNNGVRPTAASSAHYRIPAVFFQGFADCRDGLFWPVSPRFGVGLEVLSLRCLPRQACLTRPPPNSVLGNVHPQTIDQYRVQTTNGPQVGFTSELRRRRQHDAFQAMGGDAAQLPRSATDRLTLKAGHTILSVSHQPAMERRSIDAEGCGGSRVRHPVSYRWDGTNANVYGRISATMSDSKLLPYLQLACSCTV